MSEAYIRGWGWKFAIQDSRAQQILAVGVIVIFGALVLRRGNAEAILKMTQEIAKFAGNGAGKFIESGST